MASGPSQEVPGGGTAQCDNIIKEAESRASLQTVGGVALAAGGAALAVLGASLIVADATRPPAPSETTAVGVASIGTGVLAGALSIPLFFSARKSERLVGEATAATRLGGAPAERGCLCAKARYYSARCPAYP